MRGIVLTLVIFGTIPAIFWRPWLGVLVFSWFSYMNPHKLAWGFVQTMPFALIIGSITFLAWAASKENKKYPLTGLSFLMLAFILWCTITTTQAYVPDEAWAYWFRYIKIMSMIFLTMIVIQDRDRLVALVWIIVVSIGFYGIKGGIFSLLTGGGSRVWGPDGTFIADNNALAMALVMLIPFVRFLQSQAKDRRIRFCLMASIPCIILSILASYSRGGFLGLACMLLFLAMKSKHRVGYGILIVLVMAGALSFMPDKYYERLSTVESEAEVGTQNTRIASWHFAMDVAAANPIFGGGFEFFDSIPLVRQYAEPAAIQAYTPLGPLGRNMHSIYFEVLGTQGYIGLIMFLSILWMAYRNGNWVSRKTKSRPDLAWAKNLASMTQVSFIGMCTAGAFQNLAFFDLVWHIISITVVLRLIVQRELVKGPAENTALRQQSVATPRWRAMAPNLRAPKPVATARTTATFRPYRAQRPVRYLKWLVALGITEPRPAVPRDP